MSEPIPANWDFARIAAECDRLFNAGLAGEVGKFLNTQLSAARAHHDTACELRILSELAGHYRMQKDYAAVKVTAGAVLELLAKLPQTDPVTSGTVLLNTATALHAAGMISQACGIFAQVREYYSRALPPDHLLFAGLYNNMASALLDSGDFDGAENCYLQALDILGKHQKYLDNAVTCVNLAQLYAQRNPDDPLIEAMLDSAAANFSHPALPRDGYYAHTCLKCADAFAFFGKTALAETLKHQAEMIYERH